MAVGKMSEYGFDEESGMSHQTDTGQNYITVIPVEYQNRRYGDYDAFRRSATISREFLRERNADYRRPSDYKGSIDHLDKAAGFYATLPPPSFDVTPTFEAEARRPPQSHAHNLTMGVGGKMSKGGSPLDDQEMKKNFLRQEEIPQERAVEVCVFLHSRVALRFRLQDGGQLTAQELLTMVVEDEEVSLPKQAMEIFAIWMVSPVLEIQLKPHHRPLELRRQWPELLRRLTPSSNEQKQNAMLALDPKIVLRRNIYFSRGEEVKIRDAKILELLYEEAQWNMRSARYPCELSDYEMLAGIQARLELGPYDHGLHTPSFFRRRLLDYLPDHACTLKCSDLLSFSSKSTPEIRIIEQFRSIPNNVTARKLVRKYLEFSWSLPYYGSAYFHGQIEQPTRGLRSLLPKSDLAVIVAINSSGVCIIDPDKSCVVLNLRYDEMSWDFAKPSNERHPDCLPCLFLQFAITENNGRRFSKLLQVFSKQAVMMDALIATFVEDLRRRSSQYPEDMEAHMLDHGTETDDVLVPLSTVSRKEIADSVLCNKLEQLSLATFTEEGRCIHTMGSWHFSR